MAGSFYAVDWGTARRFVHAPSDDVARKRAWGLVTPDMFCHHLGVEKRAALSQLRKLPEPLPAAAHVKQDRRVL